jgi:RAT1-interacting protein
LSTLPAPWSEVSRDFIENRHAERVSNKAQYCSVVRTGIGQTIMVLGGEVDAGRSTSGFLLIKWSFQADRLAVVWDSKPMVKGERTNWVELKTSAQINDERGMANFDKKLMKYWIQSFLLGVPKIVVGFRSQDGILTKIENIATESIPATAAKRGVKSWNANMCINFASGFLEFLKRTINDEGVWRIRRTSQSGAIEVFRVEETGHGNIIPDEFINWRIKLGLRRSDERQ